MPNDESVHVLLCRLFPDMTPDQLDGANYRVVSPRERDHAIAVGFHVPMCGGRSLIGGPQWPEVLSESLDETIAIFTTATFGLTGEWTMLTNANAVEVTHVDPRCKDIASELVLICLSAERCAAMYWRQDMDL